MKQKIIDILKNNRIIYSIYFYVFNSALQFLGHFYHANKDEILFVCYGGRKYGDNVKPIYLKMLEDNRFKNWKFVWAFRDINQFSLPDNKRTKIVKIDGIRYYLCALRAKCWVTNVSVQRGLQFKKPGTLYVNTWHGVPLKRIGLSSKTESGIHNIEEFDLMLSEGAYDAQIYEQAFPLKPGSTRITGYPRNDALFEDSLDKRTIVRNKYGIKNDQILILYAPTFRDYDRNQSGGYTFNNNLNSELFHAVLGGKYKMMVRSHGAIEDNSVQGGFIDVSDYPDVEDLMLASDILVSDYSGIIFDYSLLEKPILCYCYDLEEYSRNRGFYVDIESFLPFKQCKDEEQLYEAIKSVDTTVCRIQAIQFQKKCGLIKSGSTQNAVDEIYKELV